MLVSILQVIFAAIRTILKSAVNIMFYSIFSRIFNKWLGFNSVISFVCSAYCLSKLVNYIGRAWLTARLNSKKPDERIVYDALSWQSPATMPLNTENSNESIDKFECDWQYLLDDDVKNVFPSIVDIPFRNGLLFFSTLLIVDYQMNSSDYTYMGSLFRTISVLVIIICGSSIRYQTLFDREKQNSSKQLVKTREDSERYIIYSNKTIPVGSIGVQVTNTPELSTFIVQLYQSHSNFDDYLHVIVFFMCQRLIQHIQTYGNEKQKSVRLEWSLPTCRGTWTPPIKTNKFVLKNTFKDFSFLPFVNSYVEQYEFCYEYRDLPAESTENAE